MMAGVVAGRGRAQESPRSGWDADGPDALTDLRFRALLSREAWRRLPPPVGARFSKRVADGRTIVYVGRVTVIEASRLGRLLAQAARLIGGPLPLVWDAPAAAVVCVTEDRAAGGQVWTRTYVRHRGFPQVIHSSKCFSGPTGLEEHLGRGFSMALVLSEDAGALIFRSAGFFLRFPGSKLRLPDWATPGRLLVRHADLGERRFEFSLDLTHPFFGPLIRQVAVFEEVQS